METCENCGHVIGKLETPHVFRQKVVCIDCYNRLQKIVASAVAPTAAVPVLQYAQPGIASSPAPSAPSMSSTQAATEQVEALLLMQAKTAQDQGQRTGCMIAVLGVIVCCFGCLLWPFFPVGVVIVVLGVLMMIANTRLW